MEIWTAKDIASAAVSIAALTLAIVNFVRTSRLSDRHYALSFSQDVIKWASDVMQLFKDTHVIIDTGEDPTILHTGMSEVCHRLSITWDQGRFFFPNTNIDKFGTHKEEGYRGIRHKVLDEVAEFHNQLLRNIRDIEGHTSNDIVIVASEPYIAIRRRFVSQVQKAINTRLRFTLAQTAK